MLSTLYYKYVNMCKYLAFLKNYCYNIFVMEKTSKKKLGEILLENGTISLIELSMALDIQRFHNLPLGEILVQIHSIDYEKLNSALEIQKGSL